jgi:hypothetical protein
MSYDFFNPHQCALDLSIPMPIGQIRVMPNECLPTVEQEAKGITAEILEQFNIPNLLHETPAPVRRRLLQEEDLEIPEYVVEATKHLPEFGGPDIAKGEEPATVSEAAARPRTPTKHVFPESGEGNPATAPNLEGDMQTLADKLCSSGKVKNVEMP